ncbi:MAG: hypothetical protein A2096_06385 [Spirochaetes bacterium GWF1_41_5]|nr:MAG: hypothetical protein A2096_06385 [Spirochaetes bacterium GWF1_41_5]HBE01501.1 hypothetical protein [Spirochaetia bacterium]
MNQGAQKIFNQSTLLAMLSGQTGLTQAQLAQKSGLQPSTVSNLIKDFKKRGLIKFSGKSLSAPAGGKPGNLLHLNPDYGSFGGIYLTQGAAQITVCDFSGKMTEKNNLQFAGLCEKKISEALLAGIYKLIKNFPDLRYLGIAVSSVVDNSGRIVPSIDYYRNFPRLNDKIRKAVKVPLIIENDANSLAYFALKKYSCRHLLAFLLNFPRFFGAGIILDNSIYRGAYGGAGEIRRWRGTSTVLSPVNTARQIVYLAHFFDIPAVVLAGDIDGHHPGFINSCRQYIYRYYHGNIYRITGRDGIVTGISLLALEHFLKKIF